MYKLKVLESFIHPDGRIFTTGHDCNSLTPFEVAELIADHPGNFEAGDDATAAFLENAENIQHLADAVKRAKAEK